jgi:hypothetical protein
MNGVKKRHIKRHVNAPFPATGCASDGFNNLHRIIIRGAGKSLVRPTSRCVLFDGENNSFDVSIYIYIYI